MITALSLTMLIGMVALTLDVGRYYELRRQLQNAVDAAAHAAAQELPDTTAAAAVAQQYFDANAPNVGTSAVIVSFPTAAHERIRIAVSAEGTFLFAPVLGRSGGTITAVAEAGAQTTDVVVVLDRSGSMCVDTHGLRLDCPASPQNWQPFLSVRGAAVTFASYFSPGYARIGLASYSTSATLNQQLGTSFGAGSPYVNAVNALLPAGWTNIGGGIARARSELLSSRARPDSRKVIVLLSDGVANVLPNGSNCGGAGCYAAAEYARTEATTAANAGITIYTIGLGSSVDQALLTNLATIGGGSYVHSPTAAQLEATFDRVARLVNVRLLK